MNSPGGQSLHFKFFPVSHILHFLSSYPLSILFLICLLSFLISLFFFLSSSPFYFPSSPLPSFLFAFLPSPSPLFLPSNTLSFLLYPLLFSFPPTSIPLLPNYTLSFLPSTRLILIAWAVFVLQRLSGPECILLDRNGPYCIYIETELTLIYTSMTE